MRLPFWAGGTSRAEQRLAANGTRAGPHLFELPVLLHHHESTMRVQNIKQRDQRQDTTRYDDMIEAIKVDRERESVR